MTKIISHYKGSKLLDFVLETRTIPQYKLDVRDNIFKLTPIHATVIYQIPWICWIHWFAVLVSVFIEHFV